VVEQAFHGRKKNARGFWKKGGRQGWGRWLVHRARIMPQPRHFQAGSLRVSPAARHAARPTEFTDRAVDESRGFPEPSEGDVSEALNTQSQPPTQANVLADGAAPVRTITLNRPATLNSFTGALHLELMAALDAAAADTAVRCVVITGAGRGFCAGQDLGDPDMVAAPGGAAAVDVGAVIERYYRPLAARVRSMPVPVIAAVNGVAAGAGANFALCCDLVVAKRSASFIQAFSKIGLVPDCGGTWLLPRLVGRARALGLAMTGDKLPAEEAQRMGLIWQCVDDAGFDEAVAALAQRMANMPSKALVQTRRAIDAALPMAFSDAIRLEADTQRELGRAHDFGEGVAAFFAKRPPVFKDR
jgi:2-(1,2-epoxy-1,2-dihydrophenyl)acetyl-CoA isomerase